ncbi:hypothetical protein B0H14DRAFT_2610358 [Mycena olivaceomarginata]|nr:hypothetical protein B0H14DRAFT_2610358 [Mycena olivaceomarginata]
MCALHVKKEKIPGAAHLSPENQDNGPMLGPGLAGGPPSARDGSRPWSQMSYILVASWPAYAFGCVVIFPGLHKGQQIAQPTTSPGAEVGASISVVLTDGGIRRIIRKYNAGHDCPAMTRTRNLGSVEREKGRGGRQQFWCMMEVERHLNTYKSGSRLPISVKATHLE